MPAVYGGAGRVGVAVRGFTQLSKALARIEGEGIADYGLAYELRSRLHAIGETVKAQAEGYAPEKSGELRRSLAVSVTQRSASVFARAIYGGVQNFGGGPAAGWQYRGPHVKRANASRFMDRAVDSEEVYVEAEMDSLLDWLVTEFDADVN